MKIRIRPTLIASAIVLASTCATAQVKIGFIGTLSGPGAALGQDQYDAFMLAIEQKGGLEQR